MLIIFPPSIRGSISCNVIPTSLSLLMIDQDLQKTYYCPLKKNRLVNDTGKDLPPKAYTKIEKLEWSEKEKENGKIREGFLSWKDNVTSLSS